MMKNSEKFVKNVRPPRFGPAGKRIFAATIVAVMISVTLAAIASQEGTVVADTWDGTAEYDWYGDASNQSFTITTAKGFKGFANIVNGESLPVGTVKTDFSGKNITLGDDLDLAGTSHLWTPIGKAFEGKFLGNFDGGGKTITNMRVDAQYAGLFGYIGTGGAVKNISIGTGSSITASVSVGGVAAYNYGTVQNCGNAGTIEKTGFNNGRVGGVVGINEPGCIVQDCINTGSVKAAGYGSYAGGVVGTNEGIMRNCQNIGDVTTSNDSLHAGGVVGLSNGTCLENCNNSGTVLTSGNTLHAGGIAGYSNSGTIDGCNNTGGVTTSGNTSHAGGIAGYRFLGILANNHNSGTVSTSGSTSHAGGIVGLAGDSPSYCGKVLVCYNTGEVTTSGSTSHAGGIAGFNTGLVFSCYNIGAVSTTSAGGKVGGIFGFQNYGTVEYCYWLSTTPSDADSMKYSGNATNYTTPSKCGYFKNFNDSMYKWNGSSETGPSGVTIAAELNIGCTGESLRGWFSAIIGDPMKPAEYPRLGTHRIFFNTNSVDYPKVTGGIRDADIAVTAPTRTGYTFAGWTVTGSDNVGNAEGSAKFGNYGETAGNFVTNETGIIKHGNNPAGGTVLVRNLVASTDSVTLRAEWISATGLTLTFNVNGNGTVNQSSLTVPSGTNITVNGDTMNVGNTAVTAVPDATNRFSQWSRGAGTVTANETITATFVKTYVITVSSDSSFGTVTGGGTYDNGSSVTIAAVPNTGYKFTKWSDGDTSKNRTINVSGDATYVANFAAITTISPPVPNMRTITVTSSSDAAGTVSGGGKYAEGSTVTLKATPNSGYGLLRWDNGSRDPTRTVTVVSDALYEAFFTKAVAVTTEGESPFPEVLLMGQEITFPAPSVKKEGETFKGWEVNGEIYQQGQTFVVTGESVNVSALWTKSSPQAGGDMPMYIIIGAVAIVIIAAASVFFLRPKP